MTGNDRQFQRNIDRIASALEGIENLLSTILDLIEAEVTSDEDECDTDDNLPRV